MRRMATGWVVKALLVLLIASFAVWGIGDVFRTRSVSGDLATVAGVGVGQAEVQRQAEQGFRRLQQQLGGNLERSPGIMQAMVGQALDQEISKLLVDAHARDLGITVDDATLVAAVREQPAFQGGGGFDRRRLEDVLRNIGMSEQGYIDTLRGELTRQRLGDAVAGPALAPRPLVAELARFREERRGGRALVVDAAAQAVSEPDDAALTTWLAANAARFRVPELRQVQMVVLSAADVAAEIGIDEAALRAQYDANLASFGTPERRQARQFVAPDQAVVAEARQLVTEGVAPEEIEKRLEGKGVVSNEIGPFPAGVLPGALGDTLFALQPGETSQPVQSPFGWHVMTLTNVEPATQRSFAEVRPDLLLTMQARAAAEQMPEIATRLDDELGAGTALPEAARITGARLVEIPAVDARGLDATGTPIDAVDLSPEMLSEIAATPAGGSSLLVHGQDDRRFVVKVLGIEPSRDRRLDEIRPAAIAGWRQEQKDTAAKTLAVELRDKAAAGATLESLVGAGIRLEPVPAIRRGDQPGPLGSSVRDALFTAGAGSVAGEPAPVPGIGWAVVATTEVTAPGPELDLKPLTDEARGAVGVELLEAYDAALRKRYSVSIDAAAVARLSQTTPP